MFRWVAFSVCLTVSYAQSPAGENRAPAEVDQALRARITEFYQDHVDGKFRQAEALVAEDTKDYFYTSNKPRYLSFEIKGIEYSDGFTRAKANVICEQRLMLPGFGSTPLKVPVPSTWKLMDGQWFWYVDQNALRETPFGKMPLAPTPSEGAKPPSLPPIPNAKDLNLQSQVKADKTAVTLKRNQAEQVTVLNTAPGSVTLSVMGVPPGVEAKLDKLNLAAGDKAILTLRAGADARPGVVSVLVEQTNQLISIEAAIQ